MKKKARERGSPKVLPLHSSKENASAHGTNVPHHPCRTEFGVGPAMFGRREERLLQCQEDFMCVQGGGLGMSLPPPKHSTRFRRQLPPGWRGENQAGGRRAVEITVLSWDIQRLPCHNISHARVGHPKVFFAMCKGMALGGSFLPSSFLILLRLPNGGIGWQACCRHRGSQIVWKYKNTFALLHPAGVVCAWGSLRGGGLKGKACPSML